MHARHSWLLALAVSTAVLSAACDEPESSDAARGSASPDAESAVHRGERLVDTHGCTGCHGDSSSSPGLLAGRDGGAARASGPNLTPDRETGLGGWSDEQIAEAIRGGVDDEGEPLCSSMPRFDDLSDQDLSAIVAYLKSLPAVSHDVEGSCAGADRSKRKVKRRPRG